MATRFWTSRPRAPVRARDRVPATLARAPERKMPCRKPLFAAIPAHLPLGNSVVEDNRKKYSRRSVAFDEFRRRQVSTFGGRAIPADEHLMVLEDHLAIAMR